MKLYNNLYLQCLQDYLKLEQFPLILDMIEQYYISKVPCGVVIDYIEDNLDYIEPFNGNNKFDILIELKATYANRLHRYFP